MNEGVWSIGKLILTEESVPLCPPQTLRPTPGFHGETQAANRLSQDTVPFVKSLIQAYFFFLPFFISTTTTIIIIIIIIIIVTTTTTTTITTTTTTSVQFYTRGLLRPTQRKYLAWFCNYIKRH
jgi:hypothetical protein